MAESGRANLKPHENRFNSADQKKRAGVDDVPLADLLVIDRRQPAPKRVRPFAERYQSSCYLAIGHGPARCNSLAESIKREQTERERNALSIIATLAIVGEHQRARLGTRISIAVIRASKFERNRMVRA